MEAQEFAPTKGMFERYSNRSQSNQSKYSSVERPKTISRKRVFDTAWTWFYGCGICRYQTFQDALADSWKAEKDMIKAGGCIYKPYLMSH